MAISILDFRFWIFDYAAIQNPKSKIQNAYGFCSGRRGQASLEMTVALIGAVLLLLGSFKVWLWVNERLVRRQQDYEASRMTANNNAAMDGADRLRLKIFE